MTDRKTLPGGTLVAELRRRKVFRVALVYAATAFVVLQAADLILPRLGVPEWAMSLMVVLVVLGFPVALVLGWALELTPDGVRVTAPDDVAPPAREAPPPLFGGHTLLMAGALVAVGLGAGWVLKPATRGGPAPSHVGVGVAVDAADPRSIAVLPFDDHSPGRDQEWFSDGLTEEILNSLARLGEMRVSARNSSFQFKNRAVDVREVGRQLGVANVLEGSVRRAGDQLRITAQLIRADDGFHLWSQSYDRRLEDVFAVQLDIAENIARVLDVVLDDARLERMVATGTRDPAAYLHYLRGRAEYDAAHALGLETNDRLWEANVWFERALELDPGYALARFYHHDALAHALFGDIPAPATFRRPDGSLDVARVERLMHEDLDRALADAAGGPQARGLALVRHHARGDWARMRDVARSFDLATAAADVEIVGGGWLWFPLMILREFDLSRELNRWLVERDPLDAGLWSQVVEVELRAGRPDEAERVLAEARERGLSHRYLDEARVRILLETGRAREILTDELPRLEGTRTAAWAAALAHAELGQADRVRAILEEDHDGRLLRDARCWILARIGDQAAANACAAGIDAQPQGWIRLSRIVVDHGSVPFDPAAAPRFTAAYRASGALDWPRTRPAEAVP